MGLTEHIGASMIPDLCNGKQWEGIRTNPWETFDIIPLKQKGYVKTRYVHSDRGAMIEDYDTRGVNLNFAETWIRHRIPIEEFKWTQIKRKRQHQFTSTPAKTIPVALPVIINADPPELADEEISIPTGNVYFLQLGQSRYIKIGYSADVERRASSIQSSCPELVSIIAVISNVDYGREQEILAMFSRFRLRGEWFSPSPELTQFIIQEATPWKN